MREFLLLMLLIPVLPAGATGSPEESRVGVCDLTFGTKTGDPEYVRIINADNGYTGNALQWADVEPVQGVYDFSALDRSLQNINDLGRYALVKLNGNDKPDWLFDLVPYNTNIWDASVDDITGILMYWHPDFINAYTNLLNAYSTYLETNAYHSIIAGIRQNFNPIGTEHTGVPVQYRSLDQWIVPPGVEQGPEYTAAIEDAYKDLIVDVHVDRIMPHTFVYLRSNIEDAILEKHRALFESGQLGFFHTGASMEQNQKFNQDWRYTRYQEFCLTGQTRGFSEMCGWFEYLDEYPTNPFPKVQWNYWRLLSDMHCGVAMSGFHYFTLFKDLFGEPEFDAAWLFADRYLGLHADPSAAPGAWVALRGAGDNYAGDYMFLMEREGNVPTAPLIDGYPGINDSSYEVSRIGSTNVKYGAWARALPPGESMTFHVNPDVFSFGERRSARVVYFDDGGGIWQLRQDGVVKMSMTNQNSGAWAENEAVFSSHGDTYELVNTGAEDVIFHMLEIQRQEPLSDSMLFEATDDTFIPEAYPMQNKGGLSDLRTRDDLDKTVLVKFNVDQLPDEVSSVTLRLLSRDMDESAAVRLTEANWTEDSVTWDTRPLFMEIIAQTSGSAGSWYEWDVSSVVTHTGTYSFAIESWQNSDRNFVSKEGGSAPELEIAYPVINGYQAWAEIHRLDGEDDGALADSDGDGIINFIEYALNGNPTNPASRGVYGYRVVQDGSVFTFSYASNTVDESLTYRLIDRANLMEGAVFTNHWNSQTLGPVDGDYVSVSNHYNISDEHALFIQMRVDQE